ncbi:MULTISPECIES: protealysin inhibitor emfourin [unclassified Streptomyces]|uniref:protealysin inhibitor emfourin n=1 Tax=unclassified Streptomyces TaxID=2593676 RepID=UPI003415EF2C
MRLETYGGLAAVTNLHSPPEVLDTDALSETATAELARLLTEAAATPQEERAGPAPDAMSYTITAESGDHVTVLEQSDAAMTPAFAALLTWLRKHFAQQ